MIEKLAENLTNLKKEFASEYDGSSQIHEFLPLSNSDLFPIDNGELKLLHDFVEKNPIYYNSFEKILGGIPCIVYEGDINKYWLNSIQHASSNAPFSPTWMMSGYILSLLAKENGYSQIIDIGSGDGRIAYCGKILGMESYSIELDDLLVELQQSLSRNVNFNPHCFNAIKFDYSSLNLKNPLFFIGGLAQMGGIELASGVLKKFESDTMLNHSGWVFAGTLSKKYSMDPKNMAGWGSFIENNNLRFVQNISLPTAWSFKELEETQYVFSKFSK
ncbi:MAG TPA: hypothetical protein QF656_04290 [Nitrosopumilus sp.]|jgi:hypothetical protein|nr:hypothetical protein [Nitrosopumilus sp.]